MLAILSALVFLPVPAAQAGAVPLPGTVTVSGSANAVVRVHAARPFTFSGRSEYNDPEQRPNADVQLAGRGRLYGVVLTQNTARRRHSKQAMDGATAMLLRYGMCAGKACAPVRGGVGLAWALGPGVSQKGSGQDAVYGMPAGDYDLTLLTDGAPVTARLRFHGLAGAGSLQPRAKAASALTEAVPVDPLGRSYAADDRYRFRGLGMVLIATLGRSDAHSQPVTSFCLNQGNGETNSATDAADAEATCSTKAVDALARAYTGGSPGPGFWGAQSANGMIAGGGMPAGRITFIASLDASPYRLQLRARPTPLDNSHTFIALWFPWR